MKRPTRGQWILLWSGAVCVLAALLIADQYVRGLAVAGVIAVRLLYWKLGTPPECRRMAHVPTILALGSNLPCWTRLMTG